MEKCSGETNVSCQGLNDGQHPVFLILLFLCDFSAALREHIVYVYG